MCVCIYIYNIVLVCRYFVITDTGVDLLDRIFGHWRVFLGKDFFLIQRNSLKRSSVRKFSCQRHWDKKSPEILAPD